MQLNLSSEQAARIAQRLAAFEDAQATGPDEYVVDLYDFEPPLSMELAIDDAVHVLAAEQMAYDEALDGWYLCAPIDDAELLTRALLSIL